jgi:NAD(P)-dependent dehydrogenase (short-subunit alcohol dehydrogenase family)
MKSQLFTTLTYSKVDITGQVIIITGGNNSLGFKISQNFSRMNAKKAILASRNFGERYNGEVADCG